MEALITPRGWRIHQWARWMEEPHPDDLQEEKKDLGSDHPIMGSHTYPTWVEEKGDRNEYGEEVEQGKGTKLGTN